MKKVLIVISVAIFIPLLVFVFLFLQNREKEVVTTENKQENTQTIFKQLPIAEYKNQAKKIIDNNSLLMDETSDFDMIFSNYNNQNSFLISIKSSNIEEARKKAEKKLIEILKVEKEEICSLNVYVAVPKYVDENLAGQNLGLSFCQNYN